MKRIYWCESCDARVARFSSKCPECGSFGSIVEKEDATSHSRSGLKSSPSITPTEKAKSLGELSSSSVKRIVTNIGELDRVLGGGFVPGEVVLLAGSPGSGKSTLSLSIAEKLAESGRKVLYSSGEESESQISIRAKRMGVDNDNIRVINETNLETLLGQIEAEEPGFLILDSLQTIASSNVPGSIGSVQQSKEAAHALTRVAKSQNIVMLLVNQVIKGGEEFAGSNQVPHLVDATLMLESDKDSPLKILRAHKNRFGDTDQVGVFIHEDKGLVEVPDPSSLFQDDATPSPGASITFISQGIRQLPIEIQALVIDSAAPNPRKQFNGVSYNRGQIVSAIVTKFTKLRVYEKDTFISTVAGVKTDDPQGDLAIAAALISSGREIAIPRTTAFVGEVNLTGQIRGNFLASAKVKEAERLGFREVVLPKNTKHFIENPKVKITYIETINDLDTILRRY